MVGGWGQVERLGALVAALLCVAADPPPAGSVAPPVAPGPVSRGRVRLDYQLGKGSAKCDSEALFRQLFTSYTGPDAFTLTGPAEAVLRLRFWSDPPGFRGSIDLADLDGKVLVHREFAERTCTDAADRAMLELLLWVFTESAASPAPPAPAAPPAPPAPVKDPEIQRRLDALEEANEDRDETVKALRMRIAALQRALAEEKNKKMDLTYALSAGAFITANLTSNVGPGAWLGGELRAGPLAVGLELRTVFPARVEATSRMDFDLSQYAALLTPCGRYSYFFGCVVAGAGAQLSHDSNFPGGAKTDVAPLIQLGGRLGAEVPFGDSPLAGRAWGEVLYSTPPTGINYRENGVSYPALRPDVSAFFGLGVVVRFGKEGT